MPVVYLSRFHDTFIYKAFAALSSVLMALAAMNNPALATDIWFTPKHQSVDFMDLFAAGAPWSRAASHIQVFEIYPEFVIKASDSDLRTVIAWVSRRKIALALEFGLLSSPNELCGKIDGYCGQFTEQAVARIKALGGQLAYVSMDEPLWNGNLSSKPGARHTSIERLAADVAKQVATIHRYFPEAQVGDIEPLLGIEAPSNYVELIEQWAVAYEAATGQPLAFVHADVNWLATGWGPQLSQLSAATKLGGLRFGIIYNGTADDYTGSMWIADAERHFAQLETTMTPDEVIFQSWEPEQPNFTLPETTPGTMTYLLDRYIATRTILDVFRTNNGFSGSLTALGSPVADAPVDAYEIDDGTLNIWSTPSLQGVVPAGATQAMFGLRINLECNCAGPVNILMGQVQYVDNTSNRTVVSAFKPENKRIILRYAQTDVVDAAKFPVAAGDKFTFSAPMQAAYSSKESGYVAVIFQNDDGVEIKRMRIHFEPGERMIWHSSTDEEGRFVAGIKPVSTNVMFSYPGDRARRMSFDSINLAWSKR